MKLHWSTIITCWVATLVAMAALYATNSIDMNLNDRIMVLAFAAPLSCHFTMSICGIVEGYYTKRLLRHRSQSLIFESHLASVWGDHLSNLNNVISLAEERIKAAQEELAKVIPGNTTLYELIRIGYKCVQTSKAVSALCSKGFPDQALSLCRSLMEQEASLGFISRVEDPDKLAQRYVDWEYAKFYLDIEKRKPHLDLRNGGPSDEEWRIMTDKYNRLEKKYHGNGNLRRREEWAIATRANGSRIIKAFTVQEKARHYLPYLVSDETKIYDAWTSEWQRLNEFNHITPKSIYESASSGEENVVVIGQSEIGLKDPIRTVGRSMLNISTFLTSIVTLTVGGDEIPRLEKLRDEMMASFRKMVKELESVPEAATPWHEREANRQQADSQGE